MAKVLKMEDEEPEKDEDSFRLSVSSAIRDNIVIGVVKRGSITPGTKVRFRLWVAFSWSHY